MGQPVIDFLAVEEHYAAHLSPVHAGLPVGARGAFVGPMALRSGAVGPTTQENAVVVASYSDLKRARKYGYRRIALMQHGAGQSYAGAAHAAYPGGDGNEAVSLFLCPNDYSARRWRDRYPDTRAAVIGSPRVEHLPQRTGASNHTIAVSFHWNCNLWPETRPTFGYYKSVVPSLRQWPLLGHGHPRAMRWLRSWYDAWKVRVVPDFEDVCREADVYVCDNSSTIFEFAATGRPVVVLNSPQYRKTVNHGGRFWDWATVGIQVDSPDDLVEAVRLAMLDPKGIRQERERIVAQVYGQITGSTDEAVHELLRWIGDI